MGFLARKPGSESGQSMVEVLIILPVGLLLIFGAFQFALIFHAKITLNYAAFEAARYGSLDHARFDAVKEGFTRGLAPLFSYYNPGNDNDGVKSEAKSQVDAFRKARLKIFEEFEDDREIINIERLSPSPQDFSDFGLDDFIPNDNLIYRSSKLGKVSGTSIQDANILHLRITYWYPLYVPVVNRMIFKTVCTMKKWSTAQMCSTVEKSKDDPRIPITAVAAMRMQSPSIKEEDD